MRHQWPVLAAAAFVFASGFMAPMTSGQSASANQQKAAADLNERLAKFRRVEMPFHSEGLSAREQALARKLVEASQYLEDIFWRQSDPEGLALLRSLEGKNGPEDVELRRLLMINGRRFD